MVPVINGSFLYKQSTHFFGRGCIESMNKVHRSWLRRFLCNQHHHLCTFTQMLWNPRLDCFQSSVLHIHEKKRRGGSEFYEASKLSRKIPISKNDEKERRKSTEIATKKRAQTLFWRKSARFLCNYADLIQE